MSYVKNNCRNYEHQDGTPDMESRTSCRGCKYNYDPYRYDAGCKHPARFVPRDPKEQGDDQLRESMQLRQKRLDKGVI